MRWNEKKELTCSVYFLADYRQLCCRWNELGIYEINKNQ